MQPNAHPTSPVAQCGTAALTLQPASGGHGDPGHGPDVTDVVANGPFIAQAVNFVLLVGLIVWAAKGSVRKTLIKRREALESAIAEANQARQDAERRYQEYSERLERLARESEEIRRNAKAAAEKEAEAILAGAERRKEQLLRESRSQCDLLVRRARASIAKELADKSFGALEARMTEEMNRPESRGAFDLAAAEALDEAIAQSQRAGGAA